jgi:hypothetical protein
MLPPRRAPVCHPGCTTTSRRLTEIAVYGLFSYLDFAADDHVMRPIAAFSLRRLAD